MDADHKHSLSGNFNLFLIWNSKIHILNIFLIKQDLRYNNIALFNYSKSAAEYYIF